MRYNLALIIVCCSITVGCFAYFNSEEIFGDTIEQLKQKQLNGNIGQKVSSSNIENSQPAPVLESSVKKISFDNYKSKKNKISNTECYEPFNESSYMSLEKTGRKNALGNPLYRICLYAEGKLQGSYDTVTGRAYSQKRNRNKSGIQAPAPDGKYQVAKLVTYVPHPEVGVGRRFVQIDPLFPTGRTELGLHYDPSFEKPNGQDGTSGCIALTKKQDLDKVLEYFGTYQPKYMFVDIK
ncbi:MAG: hypothetical protein AAF915_28690 [Cyanobacteria bacterium P01_D01_bin.50]